MPQLPEISSVKTSNGAVRQPARERRFPWLNLPFIIVITCVVAYGLVIVYSAVRGQEDYSFSRQAAGVAVGAVLMMLVWRFDYRKLSDFTTLFLIVNVVLIPLAPHPRPRNRCGHGRAIVDQAGHSGAAGRTRQGHRHPARREHRGALRRQA